MTVSACWGSAPLLSSPGSRCPALAGLGVPVPSGVSGLGAAAGLGPGAQPLAEPSGSSSGTSAALALPQRTLLPPGRPAKRSQLRTAAEPAAQAARGRGDGGRGSVLGSAREKPHGRAVGIWEWLP